MEPPSLTSCSFRAQKIQLEPYHQQHINWPTEFALASLIYQLADLHCRTPKPIKYAYGQVFSVPVYAMWVLIPIEATSLQV